MFLSNDTKINLQAGVFNTLLQLSKDIPDEMGEAIGLLNKAVSNALHNLLKNSRSKKVLAKDLAAGDLVTY